MSVVYAQNPATSLNSFLSAFRNNILFRHRSPSLWVFKDIFKRIIGHVHQNRVYMYFHRVILYWYEYHLRSLRLHPSWKKIRTICLRM